MNFIISIHTLPNDVIKKIISYSNEIQCEQIIARCQYLVKRRLEILEDIHEIIKTKQNNYKKKDIAKVIEVIYNTNYDFPKKTIDSQRRDVYQPNGRLYEINTKEIFIKAVLGNLHTQKKILKDTISSNLFRKCMNFTPELVLRMLKERENYFLYGFHEAYLLLSVTHYISQS